MSEKWLKPAMLGIERRVDFGVDGELGTLLAQLAREEDAALAFSREAGALAACALSAVRLEPAEGLSIPTPAGDDPCALPADHPWSGLLASVFDSPMANRGYEIRLRHEACLRLAHLGATLPFAVLPQALDAGARSVSLRKVLLPVLGERGRWLAGHNLDWKFAAGGPARPVTAGGDASVWEEGRHAERLACFRQLRTSAPDAARERLQADLGELAAKERVEFVAALAVNLQTGDEPLLEGLLKDRSREVRSHAANLLARLPGSAHARRLFGWIGALVTARKGLLSRGWQCEAPIALDPEWASAAIETRRPQHEQLGERAWWLYQLVKQAPLSWWSGHTGMSPGQLLAWSRKTDWTEALQRGWLDRVSDEEPAWVEAMLAAREFRHHTADLLALLPVAQREKHWPRSVAELADKHLSGDVAGACSAGETLTLGYSRPLFKSLCNCFNDDCLRHDYGLRAHVLELAALVHPDALRDAPAIARRDDETPAMAECAQEFERIVRIRSALNSFP